MERLEKSISAANRGGGLRTYDILEDVEGTKSTTPLNSHHAATLSPESLSMVRDYVKDRNPQGR